MPAPNYPTSAPSLPQPGHGNYQDDAGYLHSDEHAWGAQALDQIANTIGFTGAFHFPVKLAEQILATTATSISITGIPAGYRALRFNWVLRTDASSATTLLVRLNNDNGANYDYQVGAAAGAVASAFSGTNQTSIYAGECTRTSSAANEFNAGYLDLLAYSRTTFNKMLLGRHTRDLETYMTAANWKSTAAINRIDLLPSTASNFIANSIVTLWGMPA